MSKQISSERNVKRRYVSRPIASLSSHPSQKHLFADVSDAEIEALATDLHDNGLINPVEILSDGTVICGHQRIRAAVKLGWDEIQCWVRADLEKKGPDAIESRLIGDNLLRRQLSKLSIARCYLRLKELARSGYSFDDDIKGDLRDHFAHRFSLSGRQLDRYAKMLEAPHAVQFAFDRDELTQDQVLAVTRLDSEDQAEIVMRIESGEPAREVIKPFAQRVKVTGVNPETAVHRVVRELNQTREILESNCYEFRGTWLKGLLEELKAGEHFLEKLQKEIIRAIEIEESYDYGDFDDDLEPTLD